MVDAKRKLDLEKVLLKDALPDVLNVLDAFPSVPDALPDVLDALDVPGVLPRVPDALPNVLDVPGVLPRVFLVRHVNME
jgi:hypothetical protein